MSTIATRLRGRGRAGIDVQTVVTLAVLIAMIVVFSQLNDRFLTVDNFKNVLVQTAPVMLVGCAVTLVMIARGLDLSVGSVAAVAAVFAASFTARHGWSLIAASAGAIAIGGLFGLVNGLLIVRLKVNPIIATLGTMNIARGAAYLISASAIIVGLPGNWATSGPARWGRSRPRSSSRSSRSRSSSWSSTAPPSAATSTRSAATRRRRGCRA